MKLTYIKHSLLVFALGLSFAFLLPQRGANSQTTPQSEKTIDQTHKDIRALKGLPATAPPGWAVKASLAGPGGASVSDRLSA